MVRTGGTGGARRWCAQGVRTGGTGGAHRWHRGCAQGGGAPLPGGALRRLENSGRLGASQPCGGGGATPPLPDSLTVYTN